MTTKTTNVSEVRELARGARITGLRNFTGAGAEERAYRFAQWFLAGPLSAHRAKKGGQVLTEARMFCIDHGVHFERAHTGGRNEFGGFLVPTEFSADIIDVRERYGVFRRNARVVPMASDMLFTGRRKGGVVAYPLGESVEVTESEASWDGINLVAKKWGALLDFTSEVSEDAATNMGDELAGEIGLAFANKEDECGFNGDATSTYHGIVGARAKLKGLSNTIADISGLQVASGNAWSEITLGDMRGVVGRLPEYADTPDTKWYCSRKFWADVMLAIIGATAGEAAALMADMSPRKRFLGYPVEIAQVMPRAEANSQVSCLLGDLRQAARFGDRKKLGIAVSESHSDNFATDMLTVRGITRFDIVVHDAGNASSVAADRQAGAVVGLITAAS